MSVLTEVFGGKRDDSVEFWLNKYGVKGFYKNTAGHRTKKGCDITYWIFDLYFRVSATKPKNSNLCSIGQQMKCNSSDIFHTWTSVFAVTVFKFRDHPFTGFKNRPPSSNISCEACG